MQEEGLQRLITLFERLFSPPGANCTPFWTPSDTPLVPVDPRQLCIQPHMLEPGSCSYPRRPQVTTWP